MTMDRGRYEEPSSNMLDLGFEMYLSLYLYLYYYVPVSILRTRVLCGPPSLERAKNSRQSHQ